MIKLARKRLHQVNKLREFAELGCSEQRKANRTDSKPVRFIIVGRRRTGSNFLVGLLNGHSEIHCYHELFGNAGSETRAYLVHPLYSGPLSLYREIRNRLNRPSCRANALHNFAHNPVQFLEAGVFGSPPEGVRAVGFKIFYNHCQEGFWQPTWSYLKSQKKIKVLHIKRKNILKSQLSLRTAFQTGDWRQLVKDGSTPVSQADGPIHISYEECLEGINYTIDKRKEYDDFFADHDKLDVIYEDLARDYPNEMKRIQAFLGVDYEAVEPSTVKQARAPLSQTIANYDELKERFAGTPWEDFFED